MDEIEEEAKAAAEKMVMNMMQRPGQLEKVCISFCHIFMLMNFVQTSGKDFCIPKPTEASLFLNLVAYSGPVQFNTEYMKQASLRLRLGQS